MDPDYVQDRVRSISDAELFHSLDLSRPELGGVGAAAERGDYAAAYAAWAKHWPQVGKRARFPHGPGLIGTRREAREDLSRHREQILAAAGRLLRRDIQGWGSVRIQHGPVVDFDADYGDAGKYGFHYWGWARPLLEAFLLTEDAKYLADFDALFNQWYEQRHQVRGTGSMDVIYYELGLGLRNRVFLDYYCLPYAERPLRTHERVLKTLLGAARWLYNEQDAKGYRRGNWQVIGSYGLAYIGLLLPEFREASAWVRLGGERLGQHAREDFYEDGCHSERCPSSYHLIAYRDPRNLAVLLADQPQYADLSARLRPPLERALDFLLGILTPGGDVPAINDGPRIRLSAGYLRDGARLYGRKDMLWAARHLLGDAGKERGKEPARRSVHFPDSGITVMRSDWTPQSRYLLVNHGPSGGGHSHLDALSFELHAWGQALAIDAGIGRTYDDPLHAPWYRTSAAHNMLAVEGATLERAAARGEPVVWGALERLDIWRRPTKVEKPAGVTHRRHIAFVRPDYFLVRRCGRGPAGRGRAPARLVSPRARPLAPHAAGWASPDGPGLVALPDAAWATRTGKGRAAVHGIRGFGEEDYADIGWIAFDGAVPPGQAHDPRRAFVPLP